MTQDKPTDMTAEEFFNGIFNMGWMTEEEKQAIYSAAELFAEGKVHQASLNRQGWTRPKVVCLCGSTRFMDAFQEANLKLTMEGIIVLSVGCNTKSDSDLFGEMPEGELADLKNRLDELHKRKIDMADEILVLNVNGYIGKSTRSEIDYAIVNNKPVKYLETLDATTK